jgi:hypothetical protein
MRPLWELFLYLGIEVWVELAFFMALYCTLQEARTAPAEFRWYHPLLLYFFMLGWPWFLVKRLFSVRT